MFLFVLQFILFRVSLNLHVFIGVYLVLKIVGGVLKNTEKFLRSLHQAEYI